jgi:hypothetical protein
MRWEALWIMEHGCSRAAWQSTMAAWAPCWLPWVLGCPLWPARYTLTSTKTCVPFPCSPSTIAGNGQKDHVDALLPWSKQLESILTP